MEENAKSRAAQRAAGTEDNKQIIWQTGTNALNANKD